jgi:hypothetical protein
MLLFGLLISGISFGQQYSIDWCTVPVGNSSFTGGFWGVYAVQTPSAPLLSIKLTTTNTAMVYWPSPSTGYNLQVSTNRASSNWTTPAETVTDNGTIKFIIVNMATVNRFYRLKNH